MPEFDFKGLPASYLSWGDGPSIVLLHGGRIARTLTRAEWGGVTEHHSPLEHMFLEILPPAAPESAR